MERKRLILLVMLLHMYLQIHYTLYSIQGYCRVTYSLSETKSLDIGTVINNSDLLLTFLLVFLG